MDWTIDKASGSDVDAQVDSEGDETSHETNDEVMKRTISNDSPGNCSITRTTALYRKAHEPIHDAIQNMESVAKGPLSYQTRKTAR